VNFPEIQKEMNLSLSHQTEFPADRVLEAAGEKGVYSVASGKYRFSKRCDFGGAYWATHHIRFRNDQFGVQFSDAAGLQVASRLSLLLKEAGFMDRDEGKGKGKATFVRTIAQLSDGSPDVQAIQKAKADLDRILNLPRSPPSNVALESGRPRSFVEEVRGSLPFFIDLELPPRDQEPMREIDL
jgi:hypothetical protein